MSEAITVALITGGLSLLGVLIANSKSSREIDHKLETRQAVTDTKLEELTREVREHNGFAKRMPALEAKVEALGSTVNELRRYHME